ncbi:hypothetical protein [Pseudomonas sp. NPDC079086]|uniref:hypothetical protein n=1 Tax=unclassified Pseudomonas TaxID=196821 RepID=UPI0037C51E53
MLDWFAGAVASANAAKEISQSLMTLRDEELIRSKVFDLTNSLMDLQQQLMTAQIQQMELVRKVTELESELDTLQLKSQDRDKYKLHRFFTGTYAYVMAEAFRGSEPDHFICSHCFEKGKRVTLQTSYKSFASTLECPDCKTQILCDPPDNKLSIISGD